jgi:hypothetical protein
MDIIYPDSNINTPIIYVLSTGADPTSILYNYAAKVEMEDRLK